MGLFSFLESKIDNINGIEFPKFKGGKKVSSWQRNNQKYKRKDYLYKDYDEMQIQSFISEIGTYGFHKKNDVRYEKDSNTYIIIEKQTQWFFTKREVLHIAFHVKKMNY